MTNDNNGPEKARYVATRRRYPRGRITDLAAVVGFANGGRRRRENQFYKVKRGDMLISVVEGGALKAVKESIIRSEFRDFAHYQHRPRRTT
jgi:hypothetical protein